MDFNFTYHEDAELPEHFEGEPVELKICYVGPNSIGVTWIRNGIRYAASIPLTSALTIGEPAVFIIKEDS